jgi:hypothetical protein
MGGGSGPAGFHSFGRVGADPYGSGGTTGSSFGVRVGVERSSRRSYGSCSGSLLLSAVDADGKGGFARIAPTLRTEAGGGWLGV